MFVFVVDELEQVRARAGLARCSLRCGSFVSSKSDSWLELGVETTFRCCENDRLSSDGLAVGSGEDDEQLFLAPTKLVRSDATKELLRVELEWIDSKLEAPEDDEQDDEMKSALQNVFVAVSICIWSSWVLWLANFC